MSLSIDREVFFYMGLVCLISHRIDPLSSLAKSKRVHAGTEPLPEHLRKNNAYSLPFPQVAF